MHTNERCRVALQLYTVRELAAGDLPGTIAHVAALGYDGVELAGLHGSSAEEVAGACLAARLAICAAHVAIERFEQDPNGVRDELHELGLDTVVFPSLPRGPVSGGVGRLERAVERAIALGLRPAFHNHDGDLRRDPAGMRPWEAILGIPGLALELDLGWASVAGEDPLALFDGLASRVPIVHVKDHRRGRATAPDCPVGDGDVGYDRIVPALAAAGVPWLVVEQDEPGDDPLAAAARSLAAIRAYLAPR